MYKILECIGEEDGVFSSRKHEVIIEEQYSVWVNGRLILNAMTSPARLKEFAIGYLVTEGFIRPYQEIDSIQIEGYQIRILTKNRVHHIGGVKTILSGCGGDSSPLDPKRLPEIHSDFLVSVENIHKSIKEILDSELHRLTGGIHVVGLAGEEKIYTVAEDIGRHNALDRVVGYAKLNEIDLSSTYVLISGRISSEMARKCLMADIPMIVSRGATTTMAISLAKEKGLTIIGFVRGKKMNIYTHPERVEKSISFKNDLNYN